MGNEQFKVCTVCNNNKKVKDFGKYKFQNKTHIQKICRNCKNNPQQNTSITQNISVNEKQKLDLKRDRQYKK